MSGTRRFRATIDAMTAGAVPLAGTVIGRPPRTGAKGLAPGDNPVLSGFH